MHNLVFGVWQGVKSVSTPPLSIPNPMDKRYPPITIQPSTQAADLGPFVESLSSCGKDGLHNPLKNVQRYLMLGDVSRKASEVLKSPEGREYFARAIMACMPKSHFQALAEVDVTGNFLTNFGGDNVRFLATSSGSPGDHDGQSCTSYRWPYGPVLIISPFNFPLEIPVLQLMGALYMGNKPTVKAAEKVSVVMEQFLRLLHHCGLPPRDVDLLNCEGKVASQLLKDAPIRVTQFTGSSRVGELLSAQTRGKVKIEDAGYDWKILGPDVQHLDYVAWQSDQDAYACSGQKCSAQSLLVAHDNWVNAGIFEKLRLNASKRNLADLSIGPVLTHTTANILAHTEKMLKIPGAKLLFGGKEIKAHSIPECYGAVEPTAVFVPLKEILASAENFNLAVTELFGPFQVVTSYGDDETPQVLSLCSRISHHLTAAVVSNDTTFLDDVLGATVNGTTYAGIRARTTGAPQNHWFGPAGDPRGAGIGTKEAIQMVWSCHREVIRDTRVPKGWKQPKCT